MVKKPEQQDEIQLPQQPEAKLNKPEVYFIKYEATQQAEQKDAGEQPSPYPESSAAASPESAAAPALDTPALEVQPQPQPESAPESAPQSAPQPAPAAPASLDEVPSKKYIPAN